MESMERLEQLSKLRRCLDGYRAERVDLDGDRPALPATGRTIASPSSSGCFVGASTAAAPCVAQKKQTGPSGAFKAARLDHAFFD
jgi:hypothetical protein